jgi:tRNA nucleotidyltransferase (CCA-adding enzyme)
VDEFLPIATQFGFTAVAVYKQTGTVKLKDEFGQDYEYTCFRSDKYVRGIHTPTEIFFTEDIELDCRRRDFTANASYYDIKQGVFVDPLNGIEAIKRKKLITVDNPEKVFGEDGLRLMRLARQTAQLGFTPDEQTLAGAKKNAKLIRDISVERIYTELLAILHADERYGIEFGHYNGLKLLDEIGVLQEIIPELTLGKGLTQRADFHNYDILEHSFRATRYATNEVRLAALLHDIGKPYCHFTDGNSHDHPVQGERIAREVLTRLKAPKKTIDEVCDLVLFHMYDFDLKTGENKIRRFFVEHYPILEKLLAVKQADFSGCKDDLSPCPTALKWREILAKMQKENAPKTLKELAVSGKDLQEQGYPPASIGKLLNKLLLHAVCTPTDNEKARLLKLAKGFYKEKI